MATNRSTILVAALLLLGCAATQVTALEFSDFSKLFAPPSSLYTVQEKYDGLEFRFRRFVFRPAELKGEGIAVAFLILYIVNYFVGKNTNSSRASEWVKSHTNIYSQQFSNPLDKGQLLADGPTDFVSYASGRRGVNYLHTIFVCLPRHDIFQLVYIFIRGLIQLDFAPKDEISLEFDLKFDPASAPSGFVWGILDKNEMRDLRNARWDIGKFSKTTDSVPLHSTVQAMSEVPDIHTVLLKSGAAPTLLATFNDANALKYFRALVITDQPPYRPDTYELKEPVPTLTTRPRKLVLSLALPPVSEAASTRALVTAAFELVDVLENMFSKPSALPAGHPAKSGTLQAETFRKLKATRKDWDDRLEKERVADKVAEEEEAKRIAKKKAEDERVSKMSASEQQKHLEKERKRNMRKAQTRSTR